MCNLYEDIKADSLLIDTIPGEVREGGEYIIDQQQVTPPISCCSAGRVTYILTQY